MLICPPLMPPPHARLVPAAAATHAATRDYFPSMAAAAERFGPVFGWLDALEHGGIDVDEHDEPIVQTADGHCVPALPLIADWIDCWQRIARLADTPLDQAALLHLAARVGDGEWVTPDELDAARCVVSRQWWIYLQTPVRVIREAVLQEELRIALEQLGVTA